MARPILATKLIIILLVLGGCPARHSRGTRETITILGAVDCLPEYGHNTSRIATVPVVINWQTEPPIRRISVILGAGCRLTVEHGQRREHRNKRTYSISHNEPHSQSRFKPGPPK